MNIGVYAKSIVTIIAAALGILVASLSDGVVTPVEYVNIGVAVITAVGVYLIPNLPAGPARFGKTIVAFAGAVLATLVTIVGNVAGWSDVSSADWISVILAGLAAIGVYIVPNEAPIKQVVTVAANSAAVKEAELVATSI